MTRQLYNLNLPTEDFPDYSYTTNLDGVEYNLNFRYSIQNKCWYLSIYDLAELPLLRNCRIVPWIDMLLPYTKESLPKGNLQLLPVSGEFPQSPEIRLSNLSTDFQLIYYSVG